MNVTLDLFYLILYLVCYLAMTFIAFHFIRKSSKERIERKMEEVSIFRVKSDKLRAEFKCEQLLKDFNELREQYAELEAARDHYKEHAICANERAMVLKAELEKCQRQNAEFEQSRKPASEEKVADVCKEFCEKLDEAVGELELDIDKLVDECIKELMEGVE